MNGLRTDHPPAKSDPVAVETELTELRIALVLNGGVSLAIWIGGVCDELLRFVAAGRWLRKHPQTDDALPPMLQPYVEACRSAGVYPVVDVMVGASAGGLNAVLLAASIAHKREDMRSLRTVWESVGQMEALLREPGAGEIPSLMDGEFFLRELEKEIGAILKDPYESDSVRGEPPLVVRLTATSLFGATSVAVKDSRCGQLWDTSYRALFQFGEDDFAADPGPKKARRLAMAARCTASFPAAFEPVRVDPSYFNDDHGARLTGVGTSKVVYLIDGGVLANLPAEQAIEAIVGQGSAGRARRIVALVVPDPSDPSGPSDPSVPADRVSAHPGSHCPDAFSVVKSAALTIPRGQSLHGFTRQLDAHNVAVAGEREARKATFERLDNPDAAAGFRSDAKHLREVYRRRRYASVCEQLRQAWRRGELPNEPHFSIDELPFIPTTFERSSDLRHCWGARTPRHLATVLLTILDALHSQRCADKYSDWKDTISNNLPESREGTLVQILKDHGDPADCWPLAAGSSHDDVTDAREKLEENLDELARTAHEMAVRINQCPDCYSSSLGGFARLMGKHRDTARRGLLALEVIEGCFGGFDSVPDQIIEPVTITSRGHVTLDSDGTRERAAQKLTGSRLGHFGAFLLPSWRANDWMWGRLDASERIVGLLFAPPAEADAYADPEDDQPSPAACADSEHAEEFMKSVTEIQQPIVRAIQHGILADELPHIAELTNSEEGNERKQQARDAAKACNLGLARIGEEDVQSLVGTTRLTGIIAKASNDATAMLSQRGPTVLRTTAGVASSVTGMTWRIHKMVRYQDPVLTAVLGAVFAFAAVVVLNGMPVLWSDTTEPLISGNLAAVAWAMFLAILLWGACVVPGPTVALFASAVVLTGLRYRTVRCEAEGADSSPWCAGNGWAGLSAQHFGFTVAVLVVAALALWFVPIFAYRARSALRRHRIFGPLVGLICVVGFAYVPTPIAQPLVMVAAVLVGVVGAGRAVHRWWRARQESADQHRSRARQAGGDPPRWRVHLGGFVSAIGVWVSGSNRRDREQLSG